MYLTETDAYVKPTTKIFEGTSIENRLVAEKYAKDVRSYAFGVYKNKQVDKRLVKTFVGYGVPK